MWYKKSPYQFINFFIHLFIGSFTLKVQNRNLITEKMGTSQNGMQVAVVIFNEDANVTKWFTEGSSEEYQV